jgi:hypothetical protein
LGALADYSAISPRVVSITLGAQRAFMQAQTRHVADAHGKRISEISFSPRY